MPRQVAAFVKNAQHYHLDIGDPVEEEMPGSLDRLPGDTLATTHQVIAVDAFLQVGPPS